MIKRRISGILFVSILLSLWTHVAYAFYPFCEDIDIIYYGRPGSLLEQWAVVFREELRKHFDFRDKVEVVSTWDLSITARAVNKAFNEGTLDVAIVPAATMVKTVPGFRILTFPGFVTRDHEIESLQSKRKFLTQLEVSAAERGVPLLGVGWRYTTLTSTHEKPITSVFDLKGRRIRVAYTEQEPAIVALGASAVRMPFAEVNIALQKGLIDGTISSFSYAFKLAEQEVIKSVISFERGGFDSIAYVLVMRKKLFRKTDDKARNNIKKAAQSANKQFTVLARREREEVVSGLKEFKVDVNILKGKEYELYRNKLEKDVWPKLIWGEEARDLLRLVKEDTQ